MMKTLLMVLKKHYGRLYWVEVWIFGKKTGGWFDLNEYIQEKRICKACEVTFVKG